MKLNVTGTIDETTYDRVSEFLEEAQGKDVTLRINSGGGNHLDSLAIYSLLKAYRGIVTTTALGCCYSAAVLVFAAGKNRHAPKETWFMVHEDTGKLHETVSTLRVEVACLIRQEEQWAELMAAETGIDKNEWDRLSKATTYFNAGEAHELGLVHKLRVT